MKKWQERYLYRRKEMERLTLKDVKPGETVTVAGLFSGHGNIAGVIIAFALNAIFLWQLIKPEKNGRVLKRQVNAG